MPVVEKNQRPDLVWRCGVCGYQRWAAEVPGACPACTAHHMTGMTTVEWRRLADGMAEPIMEVDMETEDETKGRENADSEAVRERDADDSTGEHQTGISDLLADVTVDARGVAGSGPLIALIAAITRGQPHEYFAVLSSERGSRIDIPAWVANSHHQLISITPMDGYARFIVRKTH